MSVRSKTEIYKVYLHTSELSMPVGEIVITRGDMLNYVPPFQFTYTDDYLDNKQAFALSPDMPLIAKFQGDSQLASPHWEAVCLAMAQDAGIQVPQFRHIWIDDISILVEKRFDRVPHQGCQDIHQPQERIPYISAESFMVLPSNPTYITPYSVFAQSLRRQIGPDEASKLFDRVAFLLLVNNTDDHWKNHGLLRKQGAWQLAPLFDVNPTISLDPYDLPQITKRSEQKRSIKTLINDCASYAISEQQANESVERIATVVRNWRSYAEKYVRSDREIKERSRAFQAKF